MSANVRWFSELGMSDLEQVGGKNASLGEMVSHLTELGVRVPDGFATTSDAYHRFIGDTGLADRISGLLDGLDTDDVRRLAEVGKEIRAAELYAANRVPVIDSSSRSVEEMATLIVQIVTKNRKRATS